MKFQVLTILSLSLLIFTYCANNRPAGPPSASDLTTTDREESASTPEDTTFNSPISPLDTPPVASKVTPTPIPFEMLPTIEVPRPVNDAGIVYGRVINFQGYPVAQTTVRLGSVIWIEDQVGKKGLVTSDRYRAPQAETDQWGNFAIKDISPAEYGIVVDNPLKEDPVFIVDPSGDKLKIIDVKAGQVINLETIKVTFD